MNAIVFKAVLEQIRDARSARQLRESRLRRQAMPYLTTRIWNVFNSIIHVWDVHQLHLNRRTHTPNMTTAMLLGKCCTTSRACFGQSISFNYYASKAHAKKVHYITCQRSRSRSHDSHSTCIDPITEQHSLTCLWMGGYEVQKNIELNLMKIVSGPVVLRPDHAMHLASIVSSIRAQFEAVKCMIMNGLHDPNLWSYHVLLSDEWLTSQPCLHLWKDQSVPHCTKLPPRQVPCLESSKFWAISAME